MTIRITCAVFAGIAFLVTTLGPAHGDRSISSVTGFPGPQAYRDFRVPVLFYVESDGRHVSALETDGKILTFLGQD